MELQLLKELYGLPNYVIIPSTPENERKYTGKQEPKRHIIHAMGEFINLDGDEEPDYAAKQWIDKLNYAAHFQVTPSGVIIQTLDVEIMGAHALGFNKDSVGTEFQVSGAHNYVTFLEAIKKEYLTKVQYEAGVTLGAYLYAVGIDVLERHSGIDPRRKKDPGEGFPWINYQHAVIDRAKQLKA